MTFRLLRAIGLITLPLIYSCSPNRPTNQAHRETITTYRYLFITETDAFEKPGLNSKRLGTFTKSDTVYAERQLLKDQGWAAVTFRDRLVWVMNPSVYLIDATGKTSDVPTKTTEQHIALNRGIFGHTLTNGIGLGVGGTSETALIMNALYKYRRHAFYLGYTHQFNGQLGQNKGTQLANYGRTVVGTSAYFSAFGAGYDFWINNKIAIGLNGYLGYNNGFANYSDKRFSAGGYHMVTGSEGTSGYGGKLSYMLISNIMLSGGYNTLTGVNLSIYFVSFSK